MHINVGPLYLDTHRQGRGETSDVARRLRPHQGGQGGLRHHLRRIDRELASVTSHVTTTGPKLIILSELLSNDCQVRQLLIFEQWYNQRLGN